VPDYPLNHELIRFFEQTKETFGPKFYENCLSGDNEDSNTKSIFSDQLSEFGESISSCQECQLGKHRNKFVFGIGDPHANLMFIGEAPGKDEDLKGEPFVGKAGKLLDKILSAINMNRHENVYICNVLKCRPPQNRDPLPKEVEKCEPYLIHQIKLIRPQLIVALGRIAATTLLRIDGNLKSMRGKLHDYHGTPLRVTYHPAALLRNPSFKRPTWEDFQFIRDFIQN